ncbi:MAG: helix-turn-helix domain-containing protein [Litoreibacter sp.]|nr:helix-turn-helix domain-containing protein [Litoreibacter sp.]
MTGGIQADARTCLPDWVPTAAFRYLEHTESGRSLRDLARGQGCHPSTVLRQVRRFENRRDDPLVDEILKTLGRYFSATPKPDFKKGIVDMTAHASVLPDEDTLAREARRILRRLCESGAVLALATDMDKAVVLRDREDGPPTRTAVVPRDVAQAFALKDWISCTRSGRIARYKITATGRAALKRFLAEDEARKRAEAGFSEAATPFAAQHIEWGTRDSVDEEGRVRPIRYNVAESPLAMLARRKDRDGKPFLESALVQAGERFREDFELAQMGPRVTQNWDRFLTSGDRSGLAGDTGIAEGPRAARDRILQALDDLGPGLGDIIMRCCCFLEGLETAEKRMGWSARSGKVVLRIALQRLRRHYVDKYGTVSSMIG